MGVRVCVVLNKEVLGERILANADVSNVLRDVEAIEQVLQLALQHKAQFHLAIDF